MKPLVLWLFSVGICLTVLKSLDHCLTKIGPNFRKQNIWKNISIFNTSCSPDLIGLTEKKIWFSISKINYKTQLAWRGLCFISYFLWLGTYLYFTILFFFHFIGWLTNWPCQYWVFDWSDCLPGILNWTDLSGLEGEFFIRIQIFNSVFGDVLLSQQDTDFC